MDRENVTLRDKVKSLKSQVQEVSSEKDFYEKKVKDVKKKNQLLKLAIMRLQNEVESLKNM